MMDRRFSAFGLVAGSNHHAFQSRHARTNDALGLEVLAGYLEEDDGFIMLQGTLQQKGRNRFCSGGSKARGACTGRSSRTT
jgi:hypothetical protein